MIGTEEATRDKTRRLHPITALQKPSKLQGSQHVGQQQVRDLFFFLRDTENDGCTALPTGTETERKGRGVGAASKG